MTTLRTAAQQALEALEDARTFTGAWPTGVSALAALRAALVQQAEPVQDRHRACPTHCCPVHGCKYGHDDCPVAAGAVQPVYPRNNGCESCADDALAQQTEPVEPVAQQAKPLTGLDMFLDPNDGLKPKPYKPRAEPAHGIKE